MHFGALPIFDYFRQKKNPCKSLTHKGLKNEAEGTRTLNLRIDSPNFTFVSTCELSVYDGKKRTYGADWGATGVALGAN